MADAHRCADHLVSHMPDWLESLCIIRRHISQQSYSRSARPGRRKTDSTSSIAASDYLCVPRQIKGTVSAGAAYGRPHSRVSGRTSSEPGSRTKTMVMVHYDGTIQKALENLVSEIGCARNFLRKGRTAAKMEEITNSMSLGMDLSSFATPRRAGSRPSPAAAPPTSSKSGPAGNSAADFFDSTDPLLESAQSICERAAHVHLREGNAQSELRQIIGKLRLTADICKLELAKPPPKKESSREAATAAIAADTFESLRFSTISVDDDNGDENAIDDQMQQATLAILASA